MTRTSGAQPRRHPSRHQRYPTISSVGLGLALLVGVLLLVAWGLMLSRSTGTTLPIPRLAVVKMPTKAGPAGLEGHNELHLRVRNDGNAPLRIYEVRASCAAQLHWQAGACADCRTPLILRPGTEALLVVRLPLAAGRPPEGVTVTLYSNDPLQPAYLVEL